MLYIYMYLCSNKTAQENNNQIYNYKNILWWRWWSMNSYGFIVIITNIIYFLICRCGEKKESFERVMRWCKQMEQLLFMYYKRIKVSWFGSPSVAVCRLFDIFVGASSAVLNKAKILKIFDTENVNECQCAKRKLNVEAS